MSARLTETYHRVAMQANHDPDDPTFGYRAMLASVRERAEQRARRRRIARGASTGSAAVAAVIAVTLIVSHSAGTRPHQAAGPQTPRSRAATKSLPSTSRTTAPPIQKSPAPVPPPSGAALVRVAAAPKSAPLSLGLAPAGWRYVGANTSATSYAPKGGTTGSGNFVGAIAAMVGNTHPGEMFPTTIAGLPARVWLSGGSPNLWLVDVRYNARILLTIQVWPNARLSRAQVVRMADTLKVRDVSHPASG